ncbi:MAG: DNA adenine methylase [Thermoplasmatales archaeon]|nr:MAG: DNA adenine methylase [Thermoplasmatales archaeon]
MGSKSKIVKEMIKVFPKADNFYDLFGGGFSVTHAMIVHRSKHYKSFHYNEIRKGACELIKDAIAGKYNYDVFKPNFVTRSEFQVEKERSFYHKIIWSFGNSGKNYLFGKDIEKQKESLHNAVVFDQFDDWAKKFFGFETFGKLKDIKERRLYCKNKIKYNKSKRMDLEQLERLEQLQQLQQLQQLEQLNFYNKSYIDVPIKDNSIIYCDPPYKGTADYDGNNRFNHAEFLDWVHENKSPVFISEYNIDDKRFRCIFKIKKRSLLSSDKSVGDKIEKLYVNKAGLNLLMKNKLNKSGQKL